MAGPARAGRRSVRERLVDTVPDAFTDGDIDVPEEMKQVWQALGRLSPRRRAAEHKSPKDIIRCLKRYVAREVFTAIRADLTPPTPN